MAKSKVIKIVNNYINFLIEKKYNIKSAYLFGSYARGTQSPDSDIDIALIFADSEIDFEMEIELMRLRRNFELSIEPHPLTEDDFNSLYPLAIEIKRTGIKIL